MSYERLDDESLKQHGDGWYERMLLLARGRWPQLRDDVRVVLVTTLKIHVVSSKPSATQHIIELERVEHHMMGLFESDDEQCLLIKSVGTPTDVTIVG